MKVIFCLFFILSLNACSTGPQNPTERTPSSAELPTLLMKASEIKDIVVLNNKIKSVCIEDLEAESKDSSPTADKLFNCSIVVPLAITIENAAFGIKKPFQVFETISFSQYPSKTDLSKPANMNSVEKEATATTVEKYSDLRSGCYGESITATVENEHLTLEYNSYLGKPRCATIRATRTGYSWVVDTYTNLVSSTNKTGDTETAMRVKAAEHLAANERFVKILRLKLAQGIGAAGNFLRPNTKGELTLKKKDGKCVTYYGEVINDRYCEPIN